MTLALAHFPTTKDLERVERGFPVIDDEEVDVVVHLTIFQAAASKVTTFLDLSTFVE